VAAATPAAVPVVDSVVPATKLALAEPAVKPAAKTPAKLDVASVDTKAVTAVATPIAKSDATDTASAKPLVQPKVEPVLSGADKFRWPISGRVITDFANSKGTGINIEAPEGTAVRAAENGQVIYAGSGVEGYGNLVLIRHPNGYVSAYAHLKDMNVAKGTVVNRGDNIGTAGMTGSVSKPQLHFELRKGATPVDPIPLLAS
jgi:murein DD-endopeptidase MepM/ murein hydrolase activator NlpD